MLADIGTRSTRTLDAIDVDTLADVAKLRRHPGHSLLRLIVVGGDVLEGRTSDENQLITSASQSPRNVSCPLGFLPGYASLLKGCAF